MKEKIIKPNLKNEFFTPENCYILELCNTPDDPDVSIARARVKPGETTRLHRLKNTIERYYILEGTGLVEIGNLPPTELKTGDVVIIPPMCPQKITNTGENDLIFLCICSPRFINEIYEDMENTEK